MPKELIVVTPQKHCIFCKKESTASRSVEHIIPESIGNTKALLPPGVVCDKCNNYFSQNVEKPFLEADAVKALRFHQSILSKKGKIPPVQALLTPNFPVTMYRPKSGPYAGVIDVDPDGIKHLMSSSHGMLVIPTSGREPEHLVVSRFLAKVAVEAIAERLMNVIGGLEYLINEAQFDPIRRFTREGWPRDWRHFARRIYAANRRIEGEDGQALQTVWEYDFLLTRHSEMYFVLALFGLELTINIGGRDIEGYEQWLQENDGASPLYPGESHIVKKKP
jgi:hypothetical protein